MLKRINRALLAVVLTASLFVSTFAAMTANAV